MRVSASGVRVLDVRGRVGPPWTTIGCGSEPPASKTPTRPCYVTDMIIAKMTWPVDDRGRCGWIVCGFVFAEFERSLPRVGLQFSVMGKRLMCCVFCVFWKCKSRFTSKVFNWNVEIDYLFWWKFAFFYFRFIVVFWTSKWNYHKKDYWKKLAFLS